MTISKFYLFLNYFFSLLLFFNFNTPIMFWVLMEYNLISFILLLYSDKGKEVKQDSLNYVIFYFLIQSSASIIFLSNYSLSDWSSIFNCELMFIVSLAIKIGLFPVFFWIFSLVEALNIISLTFLMSLQKIPLFCGLFFADSLILTGVLLLSFFFGAIMLFFSNSLLNMFLSSSISNSFMMFFLYSFSISFFLSFFLFYSGFLYYCLWFMKSVGSAGWSWGLITSYVFFLGVPPLSLFFYKFLFLGFVFNSMGIWEMLFFWGGMFLSLVGYLKFFHLSFFFPSLVYEKVYSSEGIFFLLFFIFSSLVFFSF